MRRRTTTEVRAEVTIQTNGAIYVGADARDALGLGYNDRVCITIPIPGEANEQHIGYLTSSSVVTTGGQRLYFDHKPEDHGTGSYHVDAIVESLNGKWEDENELTARRSDGHYSLDSKV